MRHQEFLFLNCDVHFVNILSKILTAHLELTLWACFFTGQPSVRTANNPIEKLVGSPVLSSPLMNNSAVRVKAGRGDLVSDDWLSTVWPEGDTLNLTAASCTLHNVQRWCGSMLPLLVAKWWFEGKGSGGEERKLMTPIWSRRKKYYNNYWMDHHVIWPCF